MASAKHTVARVGMLSVTLFFAAGQLLSPCHAFRLPVGSTAIQKRLNEGPEAQEGRADRYNLSFVPVLLDLSRAIGKFQPRPGYYLQNEPFSNHPGINLNSILFNQSSPLKVPEGLKVPPAGVPARQTFGPTLVAPIIGDQAAPPAHSRTGSEVPQLAVRPLSNELNPLPMSEAASQLGTPGKICLSVPGNQLNGSPALINFDFQSLSSALNGIGRPAAELAQTALRVNAPLTPPLVQSVSTKAASSLFMLWTLRPDTGGGAPAGAKDLSVGTTSQQKYEGSFVACLHGVRFKAIRGRAFDLEQGRLLATNRGDGLGFATALADVNLTGDSSAIIDLTDRRLLRVTCLKASNEALVTVKPKETGERIILEKGQELVVSLTPLHAEEVGRDDGVSRTELSRLGNIVRFKVSLKQLLREDALLNPRDPSLTEIQRSALTDLHDQIQQP